MVHSASTPRRWLQHCLGVILLLSITTAAFTIPNCCNIHRPSTIHHLSDRNNEGENHHNYNLIADDAQNSNSVTSADIINAVDTLINERVLARKEKNFGRADMLSNQLLTHYGVVLNDSDLTWKVATKRQVKKRISLTKKAKAVLPSNNLRSNNDDAFRLSLKSDTNVSTLSEEEILAMLDSRRAAQRTRNYEKADSIRNTLKSDGVYIDDGMKEYRFDGVPFKQRGRTHDDMSMSSSSRGSSWELRQSEHSIPLPSDDAERIVHDLLQQRSNARSGGNYVQSDAIRDELYESYNIRLDDKLGEWSCGGSFGDSQDHWTSTAREALVAYTKSEMSRSLPSSDEGFIQDKVEERMRAKRTRNYKLSDYIRDKLYDAYDVTIHDKLNLWSVGGEFGEGNEWNHNTKLRDSFDNAGDDGELDSGEAKEKKSAPIQVVEEVSNILSRDELECLTVVQLKDKLRNSGLTVSGTKAKLINRLLGDETELK